MLVAGAGSVIGTTAEEVEDIAEVTVITKVWFPVWVSQWVKQGQESGSCFLENSLSIINSGCVQCGYTHLG